MTHDEAARPHDGGNDGARHDARAAQPPAQPAAPTPDERPRPRYGEYAPEGWTWTPPANDPYAGTSSIEPDAATEAAASGGPARPGGANEWAGMSAAGRVDGAVQARPTDRAWTLALLVFGAMGAVYNMVSLIALPSGLAESLQLTASMFGTAPPSEFTPGPAVPVVIGVGVVAQLALWWGALRWSRARMRAGASSWWIPLIAGVAAFFVVMVVTYLVAFSDPAIVEFMLTPPATAP